MDEISHQNVALNPSAAETRSGPRAIAYCADIGGHHEAGIPGGAPLPGELAGWRWPGSPGPAPGSAWGPNL